LIFRQQIKPEITERAPVTPEPVFIAQKRTVFLRLLSFFRRFYRRAGGKSSAEIFLLFFIRNKNFRLRRFFTFQTFLKPVRAEIDGCF
jgi:hypothetical protein